MYFVHKLHKLKKVLKKPLTKPNLCDIMFKRSNESVKKRSNGENRKLPLILEN